MKPSRATKRRRFSNKKTHRNKKRGGMYKPPTPKELAEDYAAQREKERAATSAEAHKFLMKYVDKGISPAVRMATLTSGADMAGRVVDQLFAAPEHMTWKVGAKHSKHAQRVAMPHKSVPLLIEAEQMYAEAERLCSQLKTLPDDKMWRREGWGEIYCTPLATQMCVDAVALYKRAIDRKYLPAYAPLAWMMSYVHPRESLRLCDECIAACDDKIGAVFAREAKTDCTALRAFVEYEQFRLMQRENEEATPIAGYHHEEVEVFEMPSIEALEQIEKESIRRNSKYGYALKWLRLVYTDGDDASIEEAKQRAEKMGLDFERCRYCLPSQGHEDDGDD